MEKINNINNTITREEEPRTTETNRAEVLSHLRKGFVLFSRTELKNNEILARKIIIVVGEKNTKKTKGSEPVGEF